MKNKCKVLAVIMAAVMCFAMAGCGSDKDVKKTAKPEKPKMTSVVGEWECTGAEIEDNGEKVSDETLKTMLGEEFSEMLHITAYSDGIAEMEMLGDKFPVKWEKKDGAYIIRLSEKDGDGSETMTAELKDSKLTVTSKSTYKSDDEDREMTMRFFMKYMGKVSKVLDGWDRQFSDKEIYDMSNFMNGGKFLIVDGRLYGSFGGEDVGEGAFCSAKLKSGDTAGIEDKKVIAEKSYVMYLTEHDGYIYATENSEKIIRVKAGGSKVKTLYEGECQYMQVTEDGIYFTDKDYRFCRIGMDGGDKTTVIDKAVFYPYFVAENMILYQDDKDGESLYMYDTAKKKDTKLTDMVSYQPLMNGDCLYFYTPAEGEDCNYTCRLDLYSYSGKVEKAEKETILFALFLEPKKITFAAGGFTSLSLDKWDKLSEQSYGGGIYYPAYSDGKRTLYKSGGNAYISYNDFAHCLDGKPIGYSYAASK